MPDRLWPRAIAFGAAGLAAFAIRHESIDVPTAYWEAIGLGVLLFVTIDRLSIPRRTGALHRLQDPLKLALVALALTTIGYFLKVSDVYSRLWSLYWYAGAWGCLVVLARANAGAEKRGRLILIGDPAAVAQLRAGLEPVANQEIVEMSLPQTLEWLKGKGAARSKSDELVVVGRLPQEADRTALILALHGDPVRLRYCLDLEADSSIGDEDSIAGRLTVPLLSTLGPAQDFVKRAEDVLLGFAALVLCCPILLAVALVLRMQGGGPILFRQRRLGLAGRAFTIYKFRTMSLKAAEDAEAAQISHDDARVTKIGAFLRRWGLDELPQLLNVLRGEMSLVGPRPHAFPHDLHWGSQVPSYAQRFRVRPGMTGLAQISGRRGFAGTLAEIEARVELDLRYIRTWSPALDLRILAQTIPALFRDSGDELETPEQPPRQPVNHQQQPEPGIGDGITPTKPAGFLNHSEQPFQPTPLHPTGRASPVSGQDVERSADTENKGDAGDGMDLGQKNVLPGKRQGDDEAVRAGT
jgi:putative colanic acid biosynthesis UDP-glucose lipid carrier transferase